MKLKVTLSITMAILISGCSFDSSKFMPSFMQTSAGHKVNNYTVKTGKKEFNVIRDGVTFTDGSYITPEGEGNIILPRGYYFVNSSGGRVLAANRYGDIMVLKSNGEEIARRTITVDFNSTDPKYSTIDGIIAQINTPNIDDNSDNNTGNDVDDFYEAKFINGRFILSQKGDNSVYFGLDNDSVILVEQLELINFLMEMMPQLLN